MKTEIILLQNIILSTLEKDSKFFIEKIDSAFWKKMTLALRDFEKDTKPVYAIIYSLELENPEKIIGKLETIYQLFIKEIAENYVLGSTSETIEILLISKNVAFEKEVHFLQHLEIAIKKSERKRIKQELSASFDKLTFELSDAEIDNAIKKKSREDLKKKMVTWDSELKEEIVPVVVLKNDIKKTKVVSLSWTKYAVAACVVVAGGIFIFKNTNQAIAPAENTVIIVDTKKDSLQPKRNISEKESIVLAAIETKSENVIVQQSETMGFSRTTKPKITIIYIDASQRISSIQKYISEVSSTKNSETLVKYKNELADLEKLVGNYIFDGKKLTLYCEFKPKQNAILVTDDDNYFLKKGEIYYILKITKVPLSLVKITNAATLELVEKITFDNE